MTPPQIAQLLETLSPSFNGQKFRLPLPTKSRAESERQRLVFRNERNLYSRTCDVTGRQIISIYRPDAPVKVIDRNAWWQDTFDARTYAQEFHGTEPVFTQFDRLLQTVPHMSLLNAQSENSDYTNAVSNNRDCYMIFSSDYNQNCLYSDWLLRCTDVLECSHVSESQLSYGCVYADHLYNAIYCVNSSHLRDTAFCIDCRNVENALFCSGLRNVSYAIYNKQVSKEEFEAFRNDLRLDTRSGMEMAFTRFITMLQGMQLPAMIQRGNNTNVTGNYITDSKEVTNSFDVVDAVNIAESADIFEARDILASNYVGFGEYGYQLLECVPNPTYGFCDITCYGGKNVMYSYECMNCEDVLLCVGLKKAKYCILNKQYTKEEYETLAATICAHMQQTGEWGEFFPVALSPFGYNETNAQDYYPLTKQEALQMGFRWTAPKDTLSSSAANLQPPDAITEVTETLTDSIFTCAKSGKRFKFAPQELALYLKLRLGLPTLCYDERHARRKRLQMPRPAAR